MPAFFTRLMYINANSKNYYRCHNVISKRDYEYLVSLEESTEEQLKEKSEKAESLLKAAFHPTDTPTNIEAIDDQVERNIKYAIEYASKEPHRSTILTTDAKKPQYLSNSHYANVKSILVLSGKDALQLIENYWKQATDQ